MYAVSIVIVFLYIDVVSIVIVPALYCLGIEDEYTNETTSEPGRFVLN